MFSRALLNMEVSWVTMLYACVTILIYISYILAVDKTDPFSGSCILKSVETNVDFPAPEAPTIPSFLGPLYEVRYL